MSTRHTTLLYPAAIAALLALGACNKPEAPAKTDADVMRAAADGQEKVSEAASEAVSEHLENAADAREDGKPMSTGELKTDVDNLHKVDVAAADARLKIAKEQCDALAGDAKKACVEQAESVHQIELGQAKAEQNADKAAIEAQKP